LQLRIESLVGRAGHDKGRAVAIGNFDGVHLGHARLLEACVAAALNRNLVPTVLTFEPHPASVVSSRGAPPRIQTLRSRKRFLREAQVEELAELTFDASVARLSPREFVDQALVEGLRALCVVVGQGFRFGASRTGDVETLRDLGASRFETLEVPTLSDSFGPVSSSRVRDALLRGDLVEAERYLGRPYEIEGVVVHGDHRGRTIGFPTANIDLEGVSALKRGVYSAEGLIEGETEPRRAAVNLGVRPTFGGEAARLEAHFPGLASDLYGRAVRLVFRGRIRDERRFETVEDLKSQLAADVAAALR
jgi:riboflavin kinase/FMN adenylyltransferase